MIAALFVEAKGPYANLPGVDVWDVTRDARKYAGPWPVVAHPPCARWCQLAHIVQKRYGHKVGDDGGCFEFALNAVRTWGGILEHPARSIAWKRFNLPPPKRGRWIEAPQGFVTEVSQCAYGHRARKLTWLYAAKTVDLPALDWRVPTATATAGVSDFRHRHLKASAQVSFCKNHGNSELPRISKKEASATPPPIPRRSHRDCAGGR